MKVSRSAVAFCCALIAGAGHAVCTPVQGVVSLVPDPACNIVGALAGWQGSEAPDTLLAQLGAPPASVCFATTGVGTAQFTGYSGLTTVPVIGANGQGTITPQAYGVPNSVRANLTSFTAQGVLTGRVGFGANRKTGTLFTKDTGTFVNDGKAAEVIQIVGGTGDFQEATGTILVAGQELGGAAIFTGSICTGN